MSIERKLSGVARGPADVSWDLDYAYYSGGSEGDGSVASAAYTGLSFTVTHSLPDTYAADLGNNGTKLYFYDINADVVYQYSLSTPYDISTASYDSVSVNVSSQVTDGRYMRMGDSGTKMYLLNLVDDSIYQYTLSTAWDISTASYASKTKAFTTEDTSPSTFDINPDGTRLIVSGFGNDAIYQYTLSTAWDISTASYDSVSFNINASAIVRTQGMAYNSDGSRIFLYSSNGAQSKYLFEIPLSTAYDLSTAGVEINSGVTIEGATVGALIVRDSFLYHCDRATSTVDQYSINNRGIEGLDGAAYTGKSFSVATQSTTPRDVHLSPDGTKMYLASSSNQRIWQYTLSTAFDVSTAASPTDYVVSEDSQVFGVYVREDGLKLYVVGNTNDSIFQYSMSTAFDISTISYDSKSFSVSTQTGTPTAVTFKPDGTKMYVTDQVSDEIHQYTLSTAWDVSTASYDSKKLTTTAGQTLLNAVNISSDGTKVITCDDTTNSLHMYRLTTAWEIDTGIDTGVSLSVSSQDGSVLGAYMSEAGFVYMVGATNDTIYQYVLGGVDISSGTVARGLDFNSDGTAFYIVDGGADVVYQSALSTPYDISTASPNGSYTLGVGAFINIRFKPDGTKMYAMDYGENQIEEYSLSTAWDVSTASYVDNLALAYDCYSLVFKDDGTKVFIADQNTNILKRYTLSTAWDISTATADGNELSITGYAVDMKTDGTKVYSFNNSSKIITEYALSTAWDLSTGSSSNTYTIEAPFITPTTFIRFKPDGTGFYTTYQNAPRNTYQFTIGIQE